MGCGTYIQTAGVGLAGADKRRDGEGSAGELMPLPLVVIEQSHSSAHGPRACLADNCPSGLIVRGAREMVSTSRARPRHCILTESASGPSPRRHEGRLPPGSPPALGRRCRCGLLLRSGPDLDPAHPKANAACRSPRTLLPVGKRVRQPRCIAHASGALVDRGTDNWQRARLLGGDVGPMEGDVYRWGPLNGRQGELSGGAGKVRTVLSPAGLQDTPVTLSL